MPTLDEIIQGEIDKRDAANSLLQYPADQLPWEPPPADEDAEHATEDTTREAPEKLRTLDDSDIGSAPPPPAKPEPLPPRKSALAEEAWTGKGSYWMPLTDPSVQAPAQDVTSPEGLDIGEAPATLNQVERGELVKMPDQLAPDVQTAQNRGELVTPETPPGVPRETIQPAPDTLTQVEKAQPVDTAQPAPDTLTQVEKAQPVTAPVSPPPAPPVQPPAQQSTLKATGSTFVPVDPTTGKDLPAPPAEKQAAPTAQYTQPDGSPYPERVQAVDGSDPAAFIAHHTSGRGTVDGVISTLRERHLGVEYVMDRDGKIYATGPAGSSQILPGWGPKGTGLNNQNTVGMEIIAKDDADVTDAQKKSFAQFIATRYPNTPIFGHGEVNPGHKEADEGASTKAAALALRASVQTVPTDQAAPVAQPIKGANGLYQNEKPEDFVTGRSTNFASQSDIQSGQDSGVGSPKLGRLATSDVAGVAVPEWVLVNKFGNNPAAWRKARADVVDPTTGKRLRLPIVDLGPGPDQDNAGVVVDMTPAVSRYFGGDGNVAIKLVGNAGPDVTKNPQSWVDEQAAIKQGFDSASAVPGAVKTSRPLPYTLEPVDQTQATAAQQANLDSQKKVLGDLTAKNPNLINFYKQLDNPVDGVSTPVRQELQANLKQQIIQQVKDKFGITDDTAAWLKANSGVNPLVDPAMEFWHKMIGNLQQAALTFQKGVGETDTLHVNQFLDQALPKGSDADKHALLTKLYAMTPEQRVAAIQSYLPPATSGIPAGDPQQIVSALDRLSNPQLQAQQAAAIKEAQDRVKKNLADDPRLVDTWIEKTIDPVAQMPAFLASAGFPISLAATVSDQVRSRNAAEHPDWDQKKLDEESWKETLTQIVGQEAAGKLFSAGLGFITKKLENPAARFLTQFFGQGAAGGAIGAGTQATTNIVTGQPVGQGVGQAGYGGLVQGLVAGGMHGIGELGAHPASPEVRPREQVPPAPPPERPEPAPPEPHPTELPVDEKPPPPEPEAKEEPDVEEDLNKRNEDLDKRYEVEEKLEPADITKGEPAREQPEPVRRPGEPGGIPGEILEPLAPSDVVPEPEHPDIGRAPVGGGEIVPEELGRVPGPLEGRLSPDERSAFQPLVEKLQNSIPGSAESLQAHRDLLDAIYNSPRFKPLFDAAGISRVDNPFDFDGIAAARKYGNGRLELILNHPNFEDATRQSMGIGNDPVDYIHRVLQEELLHHGENLTQRDRWQRETKQGKTNLDFVDYTGQQSLKMVNDLVKARDRATTKGNHALAQEITDAIRSSIQLYHGRFTPETADARFQDLLDKANAGNHTAIQNLSRGFASELTRQMHQIQHGDPTEASWQSAVKGAVQWYKDAIAGLRQLFARLGPGHELAKTELAKLIRATQRKLATLQRQAQRAAESGTVGREISGAVSEAETSLPEMIRKAKAAFGLSFKSGESSMLDYEETRNLARAIRRKPSLAQAYGQRARLADLVRAFDAVPRSERARVKQEFTDYLRAEQNKQPLPAVGPDTLRVINAGKDTLEGFGQIAQELGVHVKDADGKIRPMRLIGRDYYPRMISSDVRDIINNRDGTRAADFDVLVNRQIARGVVKNRQEFIDKYEHAISGDPYSNDHFSNLEKGRQLQLPHDFYDYSPEALLKYGTRAQDRLAEIGSFGQKLSNKGKDMFDLAIDKVNKSSDLDYNAKQQLIRRITDERAAQYGQQQQSALERIGSTGRNVASGLFLGNPVTAFRNLVTGAAQNAVFGGPGSYFKTAAQFPFKWRELVNEARDRNILKANLRNVLNDHDIVSNPNLMERGASKFAQFMIHYGGHNLTENINRTMAMQQGKEILRMFTKDYKVNDNPVTRARNEFIARRFGIRHDEDPTRTLSALAREGGSGPLTDEFLRQYVMDVHANYGPSQSPGHIFNSPVGKALTQFQRWGANSSRMMTREYLMPLTRAFRSGNPSEIGYHTLRSLGFLAAAAGVGGAYQGAVNMLYRRDPKDATLGDIGKQFQKGDYGQALQWAMTKMYGNVLLSGFGGLFGDAANMYRETVGKGAVGALRDPTHPAVFGIMSPFMTLLSAIKDEGTAAFKDPKIWDTFASNLSSTYRVGKQATLGTANSLGIKIPFSEEYGAQQARSFARSRIAMYEAQDPVLQQKQKGGIYPAQPRTPFDATGDRIVNGLLSGHSEDVNSAIREWLSSVPVDQRDAEYKRIKSKINSNSPLKVGGSFKPEEVTKFLNWARDNLPENEARRIFSLAQTYAKTALDTGMEQKSKSMHQLATLDYDKSLPAKSTAQQAAEKAKATAKGAQLMQRLQQTQAAHSLMAH